MNLVKILIHWRRISTFQKQSTVKGCHVQWMWNKMTQIGSDIVQWLTQMELVREVY